AQGAAGVRGTLSRPTWRGRGALRGRRCRTSHAGARQGDARGGRAIAVVPVARRAVSADPAGTSPVAGPPLPPPATPEPSGAAVGDTAAAMGDGNTSQSSQLLNL